MKTVINKKSWHLLLMVVFFLSACTNLSLPISSPTDSDPFLSQNVLTTPQSSPSVMPHPTEAPTSTTIASNVPDVVTVTPSPLINDEPIELSLEDIEISTLSFPENFVETNCAAIENSLVGPLASDEQNLYYVVMNEPSNLYRMPLDFSEESLIYSSTFENGFLNVFPVQLSNNWILFVDTNNPTGSFFGEWKLIAVNLLTSDSVVVTTSEKANASLLNFYATISGDTVYWVKNVVDEGNVLTLPSSIYAYQLVDGIESLVYEETSLDHVVTIPYVSEDYLVFERDPNIGKAPESISIALLDLKSNTLVDLPYESPGSMPQIQYPFILWKNSYRFDQIKSFTYINLLTGQNTKVPFVGNPNSDIYLYGAYPFARTIIKTGDRSTMMTLVIFDVSNRKAFVVDTGSNDVGIGRVDINSNYIVFNVIPNVGGTADQTTWLCKMPFPAPNMQ